MRHFIGKIDLLAIFRTLTVVSFWSWVLFMAIELFRPGIVMSVFSLHWFLVGFLVGVFGWISINSDK